MAAIFLLLFGLSIVIHTKIGPVYLLGDTKDIALDQSSHVKENKICVVAQPKGELGVLYFRTMTSTWQCHSGALGHCKGLAKHCTGTL